MNLQTIQAIMLRLACSKRADDNTDSLLQILYVEGDSIAWNNRGLADTWCKFLAENNFLHLTKEVSNE